MKSIGFMVDKTLKLKKYTQIGLKPLSRRIRSKCKRSRFGVKKR